MPELSYEDRQFLNGLWSTLWNRFHQEVLSTVASETHAATPARITQFLEQLLNLRPLLDNQSQGPVEFDDTLNGVLKSLVLNERYLAARRFDEYRLHMIDREQLASFDTALERYDRFIERPWFRAAQPWPIPSLSDFLTISHVEAILQAGRKLQLVPRELDQKIRVLLAPSLIGPDLEYYRLSCALRGRSVTLAYLDIDDFKAFNTRYTEHVVDRDLLPFFARTMEAHTYAHGHAYQKGGDEYVIALPNAGERIALELLRDLQGALASLRYSGMEGRTTVSIGLCIAGPNCFLSNGEMEARANAAKNFAKDQGKHRIASYRGELFRECDLYVASVLETIAGV